MLIDIPYGEASLPLHVPDHACVVQPPKSRTRERLDEILRTALDNPVDSKPLRQVARGKTSAVIVINDNTRPAPNREMLEVLLPELAEAGIKEDDVTVLVATGNHRANTPEEIRQMVGHDLAERLRILNHDCEDIDRLTFKGTTPAGLPVWVNKTLDEADLVILTGLIAPHQSAGFSGGRKSLVPGAAGLQTIIKHHSFPIRSYEPIIGVLEGNPFHTEAVYASRMVDPAFILNVVQNADGDIDFAVAGDMESAHLLGVEKCRSSWSVVFPHRFDIIIVSPGGYPRDIDLHQSQKAVATAELVAAPDAVIILAAECRNGIGKFSSWLKAAATPDEVIERFSREGFTTRDHSSKAFMWARAFKAYSVCLYCENIDTGELRDMFFQPEEDLQKAVDRVIAQKGPSAKILVLPGAIHCIPSISR
jgi:nickel-dependent lactate racemase